MGEERKCKTCDEPITEGDFCSNCRITPREKFTPRELKELYRQGDVFIQDHADRMKDAMKNECMQPPMPWNKD